MQDVECESIDDGDDDVHISGQVESSVVSKEEDDVPTTYTSKSSSHLKGKRGKIEALEHVMESTMKNFCEYQKELEERYMKWEEERMKNLLGEEKQGEKRKGNMIYNYSPY